ncbi:PREDICTED: non-specific lipid-transfer protein 1-like [Nelumbo nucifera]|uniref:Non-specific lipid-transfer protein n=2 Tax=Nelumbo nucifera TaxID=4432 RepID=A0A1U7ZJ29_NELNU|nr:PREDICTED: non-specific lipid-transfer protein 1-like [Nelumbo nucifera]DAD25797.1 TPA_asm: hypothetical protein HUJ06_027265 [Nelumbo nucifera]
MARSLGVVNKRASLVLVLGFMVIAAAPNEVAAISCGQVVSNLSPCIVYLRTGGPLPPKCCSGVRTLSRAARTTADRQTTCICLKSSAAGVPGIKPALASSLADKCGVNLPYKISPSTDCSRVK